MEKTTKYFKFDYENDTTVEYVSTGLYSMLNCSFTSEDPDYGTDTLHFTAEPEKPMAQMAYEIANDLSGYLNKMDRGDYNEVKISQRDTYGDYSNSTLYAIEKALKTIGEEYRPSFWSGHLEDACREMAKRIIVDGETNFSFCGSCQEDQDSYSLEEYNQMGSEWYGVKRLDSVFDNTSDEYIVAIGYYGGGCFETAYVFNDGLAESKAIDQLGRAICDAIEKLDDFKPQSIVFVAEEKEEK